MRGENADAALPPYTLPCNGCRRRSRSDSSLPKNGDKPSVFRRVLGRFSTVICPVLAPERLHREFLCQKPFTARFTRFHFLYFPPSSAPARPALLRLPRYFGQQINSALKLCMQLCVQQRQTWLYFRRPVDGSRKKSQYSLSF